MAWYDPIKRRLGRRRQEPVRETVRFPNLVQIGRVNQINRLVYKATPRNLRYFSRTPYPRRAINAIKNRIKLLDWEIAPLDGIDWNSELQKQAEICKVCFDHPNESDDFESMIEQVLEDYLIGAGAVETQVSGDPQRPLFMWPTDGLSIQIYPQWSGKPNEPPATGYAVLVEPNQNCFSWVINKTVNGFNVLLSPSVPATGTVAAGTFDVVVFG
jgi:hypothetical protein